MTDYRDRFGLSHHPFDKTFLRQHMFNSRNIKILTERFRWLLSDRGIGLLTGPSGVGKTACLHSLLKDLPAHRYRVLYLEDSQSSANDLYRSLAWHLGLVPAFRRSSLWRDIKQHLLKLNDESDQQVVLVIDDAHKLSPDFLTSLCAFMNFLFDSRDILTIWLVGDSHLIRILNQTIHHHLLSRVRLRIHLDAMDQKELPQYIQACFKHAGCPRQLLSPQALDAVFHISKGIPRIAGKLITNALRLTDESQKDIVCEQIIEQARELTML